MVFQEIYYDEWVYKYSKVNKPMILCIYKNRSQTWRAFQRFIEYHQRTFSFCYLIKIDLEENPEILDDFQCYKNLTTIFFVMGIEMKRIDGFSKKKCQELAMQAWEYRHKFKEMAKAGASCFKFLFKNKGTMSRVMRR